MIVGIAVVTTVDSKDESDVTRTSANVTARRRAGSNRGIGSPEARVAHLRSSVQPAARYRRRMRLRPDRPVLLAAAFALALPLPSAAADDLALVHARELLARHILDRQAQTTLPWALRESKAARGDVAAYDLRTRTAGQTDMRRAGGGVGGVFWSVYIPSEGQGADGRAQLERSSSRGGSSRVTRMFAFALTADDAERAFREKKSPPSLGMEGGQGLEDSPAPSGVLARSGCAA